MLNHTLIHPGINAVLGLAGHHAKILIADGNYPASTMAGPNAEIVSLNLAPGLLTVPQVLDVLLTAVPVEAAAVMGVPADDPYASDGDPPVWLEYARILEKHGAGIGLDRIDKWEFYEAVKCDEHALTIQTGEQAVFANLLLTIGVRQ